MGVDQAWQYEHVSVDGRVLVPAKLEIKSGESNDLSIAYDKRVVLPHGFARIDHRDCWQHEIVADVIQRSREFEAFDNDKRAGPERDGDEQ